MEKMCSYTHFVNNQPKGQTAPDNLVNLNTEPKTLKCLCFWYSIVLLTVIIDVYYNDFMVMFKI